MESPATVVARQETSEGEDGADTVKVAVFIVGPKRAITTAEPLRVVAEL